MPEECELAFARVMSENDPYAEFFYEHIVVDDSNMVYKKDIMRRVEFWKEGKNVPKWSDIKQEFQKRKFIYDSQKQRPRGRSAKITQLTSLRRKFSPINANQSTANVQLASI